jgi:ferredoxin-NADP reductase
VRGNKVKKPYSIATTNLQLTEQKLIWFVVKKTSSRGMSDRLTQEIQVGDTVQLKWPVWHYTDHGRHRNYLFVSVGSGLSPNVGHFRRLVYETHQYDKIVNLFGERYYQHIIPQIEELFLGGEQQHVTNLLYLSQEPQPPVGYFHGHIQQGIDQAISYLGLETSCFLCGKPEMVEDVRDRLEELGIASPDITFEKY